MTNDNFKPIFKKGPNIPKIYEQFILEEQSLTAEQKQNIIDSYQTEYDAEVSQGSQYGPGRRDFREFCKSIKDSLRISVGASTATGRISCSSDEYQPGKNYVGAIIYAIDGKFDWRNTGGDTAGRRGRSFYVIIKCTNRENGWPADTSKWGGMVHGYLIYKALGIDLTITNNSSKVCAGGFAWMPNRTPQLRINSGTLNSVSHNVCQSDGSPALSDDEIAVVRHCWYEYTSHGVARNFEIPSIQEWTAGGGN